MHVDVPKCRPAVSAFTVSLTTGIPSVYEPPNPCLYGLCAVCSLPDSGDKGPAQLLVLQRLVSKVFCRVCSQLMRVKSGHCDNPG